MKVVPLYTSLGDVAGYLSYPHVFNLLGEWVGFCTREREVYSVLGNYVGYLSDDQRLLRQRSGSGTRRQVQPPPRPGRLIPPVLVPLAPMLRELTQSTVDVLLEEPERLHTADMGELRPDLE
ncbi:MAG TPA: hypothetical protein VFH29_04550 [Anaerolineales bacterium]|nr:hypothetical protein [Anaerolineales bacterium]